MTDLVIQSNDLPTEAVDAFKVACVARRVQRKRNSARLTEIQDDAATRKAAQALADLFKCDAAFVPPNWKLADFKLLALDMDSTLIAIESLDEVAAYAGRGAEVAAITGAAMRGEIADYKESLRRRVALLEGVDAAMLQRVADKKLQLSPGADALLAACRQAGLKTLLATSGFSVFAERLKRQIGFDFACANELGIRDGKITGTVTGPGGADIIDAGGKAQALRDACTEIGCATARAIAIGDGANDLEMLELAGLSIGYRAKPVVQSRVKHALNHTGLDGVLNWFV